MTIVQNSTAACSIYFKRAGNRLSRQFVHAPKHTYDNLENIHNGTTAADQLLKALDENEGVDYIAMFGDDSSKLFLKTSLHGHGVHHHTRAVDAEVTAPL